MIIPRFFCNIVPNFQVPCGATSAKCRDLAHFQLSCVYFGLSVLQFGLFILFYSFNSDNFCRSRPLVRLNFSWLILNLDISTFVFNKMAVLFVK